MLVEWTKHVGIERVDVFKEVAERDNLLIKVGVEVAFDGVDNPVEINNNIVIWVVTGDKREVDRG